MSGVMGISRPGYQLSWEPPACLWQADSQAGCVWKSRALQGHECFWVGLRPRAQSVIRLVVVKLSLSHY